MLSLCEDKDVVKFEWSRIPTWTACIRLHSTSPLGLLRMDWYLYRLSLIVWFCITQACLERKHHSYPIDMCWYVSAVPVWRRLEVFLYLGLLVMSSRVKWCSCRTVRTTSVTGRRCRFGNLLAKAACNLWNRVVFPVPTRYTDVDIGCIFWNMHVWGL